MSDKLLKVPAPGRYRFNRKADFIISLVVGLLLMLIGSMGPLRVLFWHDHGNITSYVPWGLWVSIYVYLVWLEVGMILAYYALKHVIGLEGIGKLGPVIVMSAIAALLAALFIIGMDLGKPFRAFSTFTSPNFGSLMTWMIWLHSFYLVLLIIEFWAYHNDYEDLIKWLNWVNIPVGVALIGVIGGLFGVVAARPLWNGSVLPMAFLMSSLVAGTGLIALLHLLFSPTAGTQAYVSTARELGRFFMWAILLGLVAAAANLLVTAYPNVPSKAEGLRLLLFGPYWWTIWIVHLLFGVAVPILLLAIAGKKLWAIGIAATLLVITFVSIPLNVVIPGLAYPTPDLKNLADAYADRHLHFNYRPAVVEWLVVCFAIGTAITLFAIGYRLLLDRYYAALAKREQAAS